jgi:hypothetical protein
MLVETSDIKKIFEFKIVEDFKKQVLCETVN